MLDLDVCSFQWTIPILSRHSFLKSDEICRICSLLPTDKLTSPTAITTRPKKKKKEKKCILMSPPQSNPIDAIGEPLWVWALHSWQIEGEPKICLAKDGSLTEYRRWYVRCIFLFRSIRPRQDCANDFIDDLTNNARREFTDVDVYFDVDTVEYQVSPTDCGINETELLSISMLVYEVA